MKTYYSTFITGFSDVIKENLGKHIKDVQIDLIADGLVVYKTSAEIETIKRLHEMEKIRKIYFGNNESA